MTAAIPLKVELGLGQSPTTASPTWTDVSAYVLADTVTVVRGVTSGERLEPQPGEATFTLRNDDGRFDPSNASGPYYGDLTPRCPVRISITATGTKYLFRGFIDGGWPQGTDGAVRTVELRALDALGWMAGVTAVETAWDQFVLASDALQWFRQSDRGMIEQFTGDRVDATYLSSRAPAPSCIAGSERTVQVGAEYRATMDVAGPSSLVWFKIVPNDGETITETDHPYVWLWRVVETGSTSLRSGTYFSEGYGLQDGWLTLYTYRKQHGDTTKGAVTQILNGSIELAAGDVVERDIKNGAPHCFAVSALAVDAPTLAVSAWMDGEVASPTVASSTLGSAAVGSPPILVVGNQANRPWCAIEEVVIFPEATATDMTAAWRVGMYGWEDETIGDRITRLVALSDWPLVGTIDTDTGRVGDLYQGGGRSVLDHLRDMAAADLGHLHVLCTGEIAFSRRDDWWTARTASITATDNPALWNTSTGVLPVSRESSPILWDDRRLVNVATVTREGGKPQEARNAASVTAYGEKSATATVNVATDAEARRLAEWLVYVGADARPRVERLQFQPRRMTGMDAKVAAVELGDYVTTTIDDTTVGAYVVGITHEFGAGAWTATLHVDSTYAYNQGTWGAWGTSNASSTGSHGKWAADADAAIWAP